MATLTGQITVQCVDATEYNNLLTQVKAGVPSVTYVSQDDPSLSFLVNLDSMT